MSRRAEGRQLGGCEEIGFRPSWGGEPAWSRHRGSGCRGLEGAEKPPCHTQASSGPTRAPVRGCRTSPLKRHLGAERTAMLGGFHLGHALGKTPFLGTPLQSAGVAPAQIGHQGGL